MDFVVDKYKTNQQYLRKFLLSEETSFLLNLLPRETDHESILTTIRNDIQCEYQYVLLNSLSSVANDHRDALVLNKTLAKLKNYVRDHISKNRRFD